MARTKKPPVDWGQRIADQMTKYIEENNTLPWLKGWTTDGIFPTNLVTKHEYRGINALLLGMMGAMRGYTSPYYVTIKGMNEKGGHFKDWKEDAEPNGLPIVFWKMIHVEDRNSGEDKIVPLLRGWTVYNLDHVEGIEIPKTERVPINITDAVANMEAAYPNPPRLVHEPSAQAYYAPAYDKIVLPMGSQFTSLMQYAETKAHELTHSTGHSSRLNRFDDRANPHEAYAKEELVAEIGAAILMQRIGLEPEIQRMAEYVRGWGSRIKDDPKMLVSAANKADRAVSWVLGDTGVAVEEVAA